MESQKAGKIVDRLWSKLERLLEDEDPRAADFEHISEEAVMYAEDFGSSDLWHIAAVAWYLHPEESTKRSECIYSFEEKSLEIDPENQFALQYLSNHQFDEKRYEDALANLLILNDRFSLDPTQHWRMLKNSELILSARLYLGKQVDQKEFEKLFDGFVDAAEHGSESVPIEFADCLVHLRESNSSAGREIEEKFTALIHALGFEEDLAEQLRTLNSKP